MALWCCYIAVNFSVKTIHKPACKMWIQVQLDICIQSCRMVCRIMLYAYKHRWSKQVVHITSVASSILVILQTRRCFIWFPRFSRAVISLVTNAVIWYTQRLQIRCTTRNRILALQPLVAASPARLLCTFMHFSHAYFPLVSCVDAVSQAQLAAQEGLC
jgi:hypothetical protein